MNFNRALFF